MTFWPHTAGLHQAIVLIHWVGLFVSPRLLFNTQSFVIFIKKRHRSELNWRYHPSTKWLHRLIKHYELQCQTCHLRMSMPFGQVCWFLHGHLKWVHKWKWFKSPRSKKEANFKLIKNTFNKENNRVLYSGISSLVSEIFMKSLCIIKIRKRQHH